MRVHNLILCIGLVLSIFIVVVSPNQAATPPVPRPVRIAVVAASDNGLEQRIVDSLTAQLEENGNIVLSTVNPDWYVYCRIEDHTDVIALTVRVNGTVTVKTAKDGVVISTTSAQANKQDFSVSGAAQINKGLVTSAMKEVIQELSQRAVPPIEQAVVIELDAREKLLKAQSLAEEDKYDDALSTVMMITRDSPHFWPAHTLADQIEMEKQAFNLVTRSKIKAKQGQRRQAIADLRQVNPKSKRYKLAQNMISAFSSQH